MSIRNCVTGCQKYGNVHLFLAPLSAESTLDSLGADGHAPPAMSPSNATAISAPGRHQMLQKTHKRPKLACATVCLFVAAKPSCSACGHSPLRPHWMHPATGAKGRYGVAALANGDACPSHRTRFHMLLEGWRLNSSSMVVRWTSTLPKTAVHRWTHFSSRPASSVYTCPKAASKSSSPIP